MGYFQKAVVLFLFLAGACSAWAQSELFREYNPDIDKYAFAKAFITSLSYYKRVDQRISEDARLSPGASSDLKTIQALVDSRTRDNTELRIANNFLARFASSRNAFIQKVTGQTQGAYARLLDVNSRERVLWRDLEALKSNDEPTDQDKDLFLKRYTDLALERKTAARGLLEASALLRVAVLSAADCSDENCKVLVLTDGERNKLIEKLDASFRDNVSWGMKEGQSTLEACVAAIREVLEDTTTYPSRP